MTDQRVAFCPHCGNVTPQTVVFAQHSAIRDENNTIECDITDYFLVCGTCERGLAYSTEFSRRGGKGHYGAVLCWPDPGVLDIVVPEAIRSVYQEASRIKSLSPSAFAVLIRRSLEALCHDRGIQKRTLMESLRELSIRGEIPSRLSEMTDALRFFGNYGAHHVEHSVLPRHVPIINNFFRAVIEYVYVAPSRIDEVRIHLEELKQTNQDGNKGEATS